MKTFETKLTAWIVFILFLVMFWLGTHPSQLDAIITLFFGVK